MKVLMLSRDDVFTVPGGDSIQMVGTKKELDKLEVQVQVGADYRATNFRDFDILHVFNWEQLGSVLSACESSNNRELPIVLSTIFWFHTGHWYDDAVARKQAWKIANTLLGSPRSRAVYEKWQQAKFRYGERGQNFRRQLSATAQILPNSLIEKLHLEVVLGLKGHLQRRCTIVPNGVDRELYDPLPAPNEKFWKEYRLEDFVLEVARIQSAKNQLGLLEALSDTTFPIVFIGQPSPYEKDYVECCYDRAKQRGNVYFIEPKSSQELAGIYPLAAVHVLPSWRETPGLASLEAASAGCRIVTTSIGSTREYFGDEAWYCDPRDTSSIRKAVLAALESPPSEKLRSTVLDRFTWGAAAKKTLEAYHRVLDQTT